MPDPPRLDALERALRALRDVVAPMVPGDLALPTPCEDHDVRGLLDHVVGWQRVFAACAADEPPHLVGGSPAHRSSTDPAGDLAAATAALVANLRRRSDPSITVPYRGVTPVARLVDELVAETVIHAWDLATALGTTVEVDRGTLAVAHAGLSALLAESFAAEGFRPPRGNPAPGDELERLVVRSGRVGPRGRTADR